MNGQALVVERKDTQTEKKISPIEYFYHWEKTTPNNVFFKQAEGNTWSTITWNETGDQIRRIVSFLESTGLPKGTKVGIVSKNCPHWIMSDLAIAMAGMVSVPFYPTLNSEQLLEVIVHSETKVLFVGKLDSWDIMKDGVPNDVIVIRTPSYKGSAKVERENAVDWDDLVKKHEPKKDNYIPDIHDISTIIYTSGTTGTPKGVMHTYFTQVAGLGNAIEPLRLNKTNPNEEFRFFSYLPLSHIAERQIVELASVYSGGSISFAESLDTFAKNLAEARPTHFLAVPRIWTKFQLGVLSKMPQKKLDSFLRIPILSGIVKRKIKKTLGLDATKILLTGAAPMPSSLLQWYQKIGIQIQEAYGMTENGGCCTLMPRENQKMGTVGKAYPTAQIKIDPENGEVLMKSDWVMTGYYKDQEKTDEVIVDGWLHTGDMGELDKDGFLKITGRVKDTFKSAKGEFIVPSPIEFGFAKNSFIEQVCIAGRGLPQPVALVVLSDIAKGASKEEINESLVLTLGELNKTLVSYEKVDKIIVMKEPWTIENNIMTPTLKIKRNIVEERYGLLMDQWCQQKGQIVWE